MDICPHQGYHGHDRRVERRQLEYFLAVVAHGGFTGAARALHVSQPSLSHAIATLEGEVGGRLFHRLPQGAVLSPAGHALVGPARQVLRDLQTAATSVREVLGLEGGRLDVAAQTALAVDPLAAMVGGFLREHPRVDVRVSAPDRSDVEQMVRTGECELGLLRAGTVTGDLAGLDLLTQDLLLTLPPGHAAPTTAPTPHRELVGLSFVTSPPGTLARDVLDDTLHGVDAVPRIAVETAHRAMLAPLVVAGAGAALLPRAMAVDAAAQGASVVPTDPPLHVRGRLVWRRGPLSPAARAFAEHVAASFAAEDAEVPEG